MAGAHQIHPNPVTSPDQVPQRLLFIAGDADRVQLASQQQPHQMLSIPTIGLDPIP